MRAPRRWALPCFVVLTSFAAASALACAAGEELSGAPAKADGSTSVDTGEDDDASVEDSAATDSSATPDTSTDTGGDDTSTSPPDTGSPDTGTPDTGTPDTGTPDTGPEDTGPPDTGTVVDTGTPVTCAPSGEYGPKCATAADCVLAPGSCGYVCCAFDPIIGTISLGCGRTAIGGACLP